MIAQLKQLRKKQEMDQIKPKKTYKDTLVTLEQTILDVLRSLHISALQISLVVDGHGKLLGTVTDGDIRRAILDGFSLDSPISGIMNKKPVTVQQDCDPSELLHLMSERKIYQVPVLDSEGRVCDLRLISSIISEKDQKKTKAVTPGQRPRMSDINVVLMLGGEGKRLQPLTQDLPKPMLSVGGKPLLETILENMVEQGFTEFFFSVNYKADIIRDYFGDGKKFGANITYVLEEKKMGTAGSLSLLPELAQKRPLVVMNGDLLTNINFQNLLDFHYQNHALATMCVREYQYQIPYGIIKNEGIRLDSIVEKPSHTYFVNAGIYALDPKALDDVPKDIYFDMPQLFSAIKERGGDATVFPIHEYWMDIGRVEDLERAREEYSRVFTGKLKKI